MYLVIIMNLVCRTKVKNDIFITDILMVSGKNMKQKIYKI